MDKTALILIDYQMDYFAGGRMELVHPVPAVERGAQLLDCFHKNREPVFILQHISLRPDAPFFLPDTNGIALHPLLQPAETDTVLQKH
ncbi:MAG TPA: isochorismatase family protein, partial [Desulfobulbus sp.]|nr:isochorismatase family protein [Desulfobulbus sp.]